MFRQDTSAALLGKPPKYIKNSVGKMVLNPAYKEWRNKNGPNPNPNLTSSTSSYASTSVPVAVAEDNKAVAVGRPIDTPPEAPRSSVAYIERKLGDLEKLKSLLTEEEYERKRAEIIDSLGLSSDDDSESTGSYASDCSSSTCSYDYGSDYVDANDRFSHLDPAKVRRDDQGQLYMYSVEVPHGVRAGDTFRIFFIDGKEYAVTCPMGARAGKTIVVPVRLPEPEPVAKVTPFADASPSTRRKQRREDHSRRREDHREERRYKRQERRERLKEKKDRRQSRFEHRQRRSFTRQQQEGNDASASASASLFTVIVPEGVGPGQRFRTTVPAGHGQRPREYEVVCPPGAGPGAKVQFRM
ncbi:unnamed protein product [Pseudo-nitzschia multistriata]|uniref:Uncharacterized protein n=1 Tax=Pseudo-nitzschia multistriata TaxID=183589 RepID=A0A448ZPB9_9STRA|nr:unnamed protein product [Pseudo-nitzschia multistriata]